jgi:hypothetical protein
MVLQCSLLLFCHQESWLCAVPGWWGWTSWELCISQTCPATLKHSNPITHTFLWGNTPPCWVDKCLWISTPFRTSTHNKTNSPLFFLGADWQWCTHVLSSSASNMLSPRSPWVLFQHFGSWVSMLPTVTSVACSCSRLKKVDTFWIALVSYNVISAYVYIWWDKVCSCIMVFTSSV